MEIDLTNDSLPVFKALNSETRLEIINKLAQKSYTVTELADELHYSKAVISKHIRILEDAGILVETTQNMDDRRKKYLQIVTDSILINLPQKIYPEFRRIDYDIELGNYFSNQDIEPTCGMVGKDSRIGKFDDPEIFLSPQRFKASLIWFSNGTVEYVVPNKIPQNASPELIEVSMEVSSEFPQSNNNWPSDLSFWINDVFVGFDTVPGNYSDVRGRLTPSWWDSSFSQYGLLKHLRVLKTDTAIDGESISDITINDLNLTSGSTIKFKIGIDPASPNQGGITIFGKDFGNYPQNIKLSVFYSINAH